MSGRLHGRAPSLTVGQVAWARAKRAHGHSLRGLARELGVARSTLQRHLAEPCKHHVMEARR